MERGLGNADRSAAGPRYTVCPSVPGDARYTVSMLKGRPMAGTGAAREWHESVGGWRKRMKNGIVRVITLTARRMDKLEAVDTSAGARPMARRQFFYAVFSTNLKIHTDSSRLKDALSRLRASHVTEPFTELTSHPSRTPFAPPWSFFLALNSWRDRVTTLLDKLITFNRVPRSRPHSILSVFTLAVSVQGYH